MEEHAAQIAKGARIDVAIRRLRLIVTQKIELLDDEHVRLARERAQELQYPLVRDDDATQAMRLDERSEPLRALTAALKVHHLIFFGAVTRILLEQEALHRRVTCDHDLARSIAR